MARRKGLTIPKVRRSLYRSARILDDVQAVRTGRVSRRIASRGVGKLARSHSHARTVSIVSTSQVRVSHLGLASLRFGSAVQRARSARVIRPTVAEGASTSTTKRA